MCVLSSRVCRFFEISVKSSISFVVKYVWFFSKQKSLIGRDQEVISETSVLFKTNVLSKRKRKPRIFEVKGMSFVSSFGSGVSKKC